MNAVSAIGSAAGLLVLSWMAILAPHFYRILRPSIVAYPWDDDDDSGGTTDDGKSRNDDDDDDDNNNNNNNNNNKKKKKERNASHRIVVFAASYNPPHNGHLRMLEHLSKKYDRVIAVVGFNPEKRYLVSPEDRADLLRRMLGSRSIDVEVEVVEGYIWRYAKRIGATLFFRGIRSWEKDGRDERHLQILNTWGPLLYGPLAVPIPTVYIQGDPRYNHVSSTLVRTICGGNGGGDGGGKDGNTDDECAKSAEAALSELVPPEEAARVAKLYGAKR